MLEKVALDRGRAAAEGDESPALRPRQQGEADSRFGIPTGNEMLECRDPGCSPECDDVEEVEKAHSAGAPVYVEVVVPARLPRAADSPKTRPVRTPDVIHQVWNAAEFVAHERK